jgi:hypothetical protein
MPTAFNLGPDHPSEIRLALQVSDVGDADFIDSIQKLEAHLKAQYPKVRAVNFIHPTPRTREPRTSDWRFLLSNELVSLHQYEVWIVVTLVYPFTKKIMEDVAHDTYNWFKKRLKPKPHRKPAPRVRKRPRKIKS